MFDPKVIDEITREIKELGDNWKGLSESMATDLATVRRLAEDIKGAVGPEVKAQMDALTASVTEKHAAPESKFSARLTTLETKANRHGMGGGFSEAQDKAAASRGRGATTGAGHGELLIRDIIRHDGCGGWPRKAEQLTAVEGASSRPRRPSGRTIGYRLASVTGSVASSLDADTISDRC